MIFFKKSSVMRDRQTLTRNPFRARRSTQGSRDFIYTDINSHLNNFCLDIEAIIICTPNFCPCFDFIGQLTQPKALKPNVRDFRIKGICFFLLSENEVDLATNIT